MSWTDDRVEVLKKLWGEGRTAAEIAKELGGVTRNAVIGKAHRLKLSNRASPIQQNTKKAAPAVAANISGAQAESKNVTATLTKNVANTNVAAPKTTEKAAPLKPVMSESDAKRKRWALTDLESNMCRWPLGDPRETNFGFCGGRADGSKPYCEEHTAVAYQASGRNRVLKAEDFEKAEERAAAKAAAE